MSQETTQSLEQPPIAQSSSPGVDARVFVMPERYRHGAQGVMHQPEDKRSSQPPVEVKTPGVPLPPKAPPKAPASTLRKSSATKKIMVIGVVVLLALGIGGYVLIRLNPQVSETPVVTTTTRPAPTTETSTDPEESTTKPVEKPTEAVEVFPVEVLPGTDSDSDGLTDTEEKLVYGTDPRLPDTDSDGFLDGNEVFHRYNPGALGTLFESGLVKAMSSTISDVTYEFYYPEGWDVDETEEELVLDAQTGEGFRISFIKKSPAQTLPDWADVQLALDRSIIGTTKNGLDLIQGEDQLSAYIDLGSQVMVFEYDTGIKTRVDYLQTFQMMINSVQVVSVEEVSEQIDVSEEAL
ncbi:hypothetical protein HQ487_03815 [Candidatus Uhrbacteria bacterium]|nr:hypothetical protein [Candidatus Uhrbacteria bacterium]